MSGKVVSSLMCLHVDLTTWGQSVDSTRWQKRTNSESCHLTMRHTIRHMHKHVLTHTHTSNLFDNHIERHVPLIHWRISKIYVDVLFFQKISDLYGTHIYLVWLCLYIVLVLKRNVNNHNVLFYVCFQIRFPFSP